MLTADGFPIPEPGHQIPPARELKRWAGRDPDESLPGREYRDICRDWTAAMQEAGWCLVWLDPHTGQVAGDS